MRAPRTGEPASFKDRSVRFEDARMPPPLPAPGDPRI